MPGAGLGPARGELQGRWGAALTVPHLFHERPDPAHRSDRKATVR